MYLITPPGLAPSMAWKELLLDYEMQDWEKNYEVIADSLQSKTRCCNCLFLPLFLILQAPWEIHRPMNSSTGPFITDLRSEY